MTPYTFTNNPTPLRGGDYDLGNGVYCRVTVIGPTPDPNNSDALIYQAMAQQLDSSGTPVKDATGAPVQTHVLPKMTSKSGVGTKQFTMYPGWCRYIPKQNEIIDPANLPSGWTSGASLPATGTAGDCFCVTTDNSLWTYSNGNYYAMHVAMA